jgi:hypothetical protein
MKDHAPILQFSGYPPAVAVSASDLPFVPVSITPLEPKKEQTTVADALASNPKSWDEDWFGNYE